METIDGDSTHRHIWRRIGAHALHAGHKPRGDNPHPEKRVAIREIRHVSVCVVPKCKEVRVHIRRETTYTFTPEQAEALALEICARGRSAYEQAKVTEADAKTAQADAQRLGDECARLAGKVAELEAQAKCERDTLKARLEPLENMYETVKGIRLEMQIIGKYKQVQAAIDEAMKALSQLTA